MKKINKRKTRFMVLFLIAVAPFLKTEHKDEKWVIGLVCVDCACVCKNTSGPSIMFVELLQKNRSQYLKNK